MLLLQAASLHPPGIRPPGVETLQLGGITFSYRTLATAPERATIEHDATEFFRINQELYSQTEIVEFRFPTVFPDIAQMQHALQGRSPRFKQELERLAGHAQLTVYPSARPPGSVPVTGTDYLRNKQKDMRAHATLVDELARLIPGLRETVWQGARLLLLVPRHQVEEAIRLLAGRKDLRVAGPFPPSGFAKLLS